MLLLFSFITNAFTQDFKHALELGGNFSNDNKAIYFPAPSLSFYWIKSRGYHEISGEFYRYSKGNIEDHNREKYSQYGISYSFLFKLPINELFIGPAVGIWNYEYHKQLPESDPYNPSTKSGLSSVCFGGLKTGAILGKKGFRIKFQDRVILGMSVSYFGNMRFAFMNTASMSFLVAF